MQSKVKFFLVFVLIIVFSGCSFSVPSLNERTALANNLIKNKDIHKKIYKTEKFNIYSYKTNLQNCSNINLFIEGDGLAWLTRTIISSDPTPTNPIALKLMLKDKSSCKVYFARPCQYTNSNICEKKYWTSHRFSEEIIETYKEVLSQIKSKYKNKSFNLIGFSGGGAIATILASTKNDIKKLITVAGNLDTKKWVQIHNISPLNGSLNPVDFTNNLNNISQIHIVGSDDRIIPIEVFNSFKNSFKTNDNIKLKVLEGTHSTVYKNVDLNSLLYDN